MGQISTETDRSELHELLDRVPASDLPTARKILQALVTPMRFAVLTAPLDDESESEEERAEVEEARAEQGPGTPHEEVLREFGL